MRDTLSFQFAGRVGVALVLLCSPLTVGCGDSDSTASQDPPIPYADPLPAAGDRADRGAPRDAIHGFNAGDAATRPGGSGDGASVPGAAAAPKEEVVKSGPFEKRFDRLALAIPKGWDEVKLAQSQVGFVDARFVVKTKAGLVELTCLTSRGGLDANINRWIGQFQLDPEGKKAETLRVGGVEARWVDLTGTFNASSSGKAGPHADWRMLGAGIPTGDSDFFLKLNGPKAAVAEVSDAFRELVKSAREIAR